MRHDPRKEQRSSTFFLISVAEQNKIISVLDPIARQQEATFQLELL